MSRRQSEIKEPALSAVPTFFVGTESKWAFPPPKSTAGVGLLQASAIAFGVAPRAGATQSRQKKAGLPPYP